MHASRRWTLALFLLAFVIARVTGAHLHLCLDGSEPPAQLHVSDTAELGHHAEESQTHDDVDVELLSDVVAKVSKIDLPVLVFVAWCLALVLISTQRVPVPVGVRAPPYRPPRFLRPLLRGPPA